MIVLLPVSRFRAPFDIARGKPYSPLERTVLLAVGNGGRTLQALQAEFRVHERLLVESVVTLVTAGWVAVANGAQATFVLTAAGQVAENSGKDPVSVVVSAALPALLVMERFAGQVARHADAKPWRREDLADVWDTAARLPTRNIRNSVDEAHAQKLLPRRTGEWIRRIGRIDEISRDAHYLPLEVDPVGGVVRGLPSSWHAAIAPHALSVAKAAAASDDASRPTSRRAPAGRRRPLSFQDAPPVRKTTTQVLFGPRTAVVGRPAHDAALDEAVAGARTSLALAVPHVPDLQSFQRLAERVAVAVARGVRVDLLVGTASLDAPAQGIVAEANRIGYGADARAGRSLLRARNHVTGSGASLLVWDRQDRTLTAVLGDSAWLDGVPEPRDPVGVRLNHPAICGDLARAVAALWIGRGPRDTGHLGSAERWRMLADDAEERAAAADARDTRPRLDAATDVELLVDDECVTGRLADGTTVVGGSLPDPDAGDGARRGLQLRVTGLGAALLPARPEERP